MLKTNRIFITATRLHIAQDFVKRARFFQKPLHLF
jgi:hypothetical protein